MNILSKQAASAMLMILGMLLAGCGRTQNVSKPWQMGERVQIGQLIYTVLESEWKTELQGNKGTILPKNRFLVLKVSVTNGGGEEKSLGFLQIKNEKGEEFTEFSELEGVNGWLGIIRRLAPAANEQGIIVFDLPLAVYMLSVTDGANAGEERVATITIPLVMKPEGEMPETPLTGR